MEYVSQNSGSGRQTVMFYSRRRAAAASLKSEYLSRKLLQKSQDPVEFHHITGGHFLNSFLFTNSHLLDDVIGRR